MKNFKFILLILICACLLWVVGRYVLPSTWQPAPRSSDSLVGRASCTQEPVFTKNEQTPSQDIEKLVATEVSASPVPLISGGEKTDISWTSRTPAAKRVRRIFPDLPAPLDGSVATGGKLPDEPVLKAGDMIRLALFDDAVFDAKISNVTCYPNGAVGMTAHLQGDQQGTVYLSHCDQQFRVSVEVMGGADYYVRYNPETGEHYAIEVDRENTEVRACGDVVIPHPAPDAKSFVGPASCIQEPVGLPPSGDMRLSEQTADPTVIDVMIVYTPKALSDEGSQAGMNNNITIAMQKSNEAHANSATEIYLNLVHSALTPYVESGNDYTDVQNLRNTTDGYMDEVHTLRNTFSADFVCLFSDTATVGGVAYSINTYESGKALDAFCLAWRGQTDTGYTLVHEWGHNMGCSHSKSQVIGPWANNSYHFRDYSAGWQWSDSSAPSPKIGYCSVMTYEDHNNDETREYFRVAHFSNPNKFYNGKATGHIADGDNARTIREMRSYYAAYRDPPPTPPVIETAPASLALAADLDAPELTDSTSLVISNAGESTLSFLITDGTQTNTYTWADSNDPGGPVFDWIDITSNYTGEVLLQEEAESTMLNIGFLFPFFEGSYTQFQIAANGGISLDSADLYYFNFSLPAATNYAPGLLIAPFWDNLGAWSGTDSYRYRCDPERLVVTYPAISLWTDFGTNPNTFQIILYEDGRIVFQYLDMQGDVDSATVGIQSVTNGVEGGLVGSSIQVAHNEPYITNGLAVEFRPPLDWLSYSNASGTVATNASTSIPFIADASTLPTGTYQTVVTVLHNDPAHSAVEIPLVFTVTGNSGTPGDLDNDGLPDEWETQYFGGSTNANPVAMASNGVNTVWETYIAGLDPTSLTNRFHFSVLCPPSSDPVLGWNATSGRVYSVYSTTNLLSDFLPLKTNILFPQSSHTDTLHKSRFYKIDVELE